MIQDINKIISYLIFKYFLVIIEAGSHYVAQVTLELLGSSEYCLKTPE